MKTDDILSKEEKGIIHFLRGEAQAFIRNVAIYEDVPDKISICDALYLEGSFIAEIVWSGYRIIYPSLNGQEDLFYFSKDNIFEIGFDFYEICEKWKDYLTYDQKEAGYFEKEGLFRPGCTFFSEIKRVKIGEAIVLWDEGGWDLITLPFRNWTVTEDSYKQALLAYMQLQKPGSEKEFILFSGGRDSTLLTFLLKKELGCPLNMIMGKTRGMDLGGNDEERREYFSAKLSLPIEEIRIDYNDYSFEDLGYLIDDMPLTAHIGIGFHVLNNRIEKEKGRAWTGQDADSIYALGLTGGVFRSILARGMISDMYIGSLRDVAGPEYARLYGKFLAAVCSCKKGRRFLAPSDVNELRTAVQENYASVPLLDERYYIKGIDHSPQITTTQARRELLFDKISYYIVGRDHRIITYAGKLSKRPIYPYSSAMMELAAVNMKMGVSDVLINKKYISNLIKYYIGDRDFRKLYPMELFHTEKLLYKSQADILHNTRYGISLSKAAGGEYKTITETLNKAWLCAVMNKLNWKGKSGDGSK